MSWEMTQAQIDKAIFEHMDAASRFAGEDVNLVAAEILLLASQTDHSIRPNPTNHQLIMDNLNVVGGVRMHQAIFPFLMKSGICDECGGTEFNHFLNCSVWKK